MKKRLVKVIVCSLALMLTTIIPLSSSAETSNYLNEQKTQNVTLSYDGYSGLRYSMRYFDGISSSSTNVYNCPNSSSNVVGYIGIESVKIFWQTNGYYYIEYNVSSGEYGGYKMGYVPSGCIRNTSGFSIPNEKVNETGYHTPHNFTVYNRPDMNSLAIGTVYSTDNILFFREADCDDSWYAFSYIQYPAPGTPGGYKRGWINYLFIVD